MLQNLKSKDFSFVFSLQLFTMMLLTPLPLLGRHELNTWIAATFESPIYWIKCLFFETVENYTALITDSQNYIALLIIGFLLGTICAVILLRISLNVREQILQFIRVALTYYISWILMAYGFSKLQMIQFPPLDQVTSQMKIGEMDLDVLFWTTIGASKGINIVFGSIEVLAALLLLFQRTRQIGLLISLIIASQIIVFNFSFDISVKYFASLLWLSIIYLSYNTLRQIGIALLHQRPLILEKGIRVEVSSILKNTLKIILIGGILISAIFG